MFLDLKLLLQICLEICSNYSAALDNDKRNYKTKGGVNFEHIINDYLNQSEHSFVIC